MKGVVKDISTGLPTILPWEGSDKSCYSTKSEHSKKHPVTAFLDLPLSLPKILPELESSLWSPSTEKQGRVQK